MKNTDLPERISAISKRAAEEDRGELDTARMLFDEMAAEARRRGEIEREEARRRSPFVKFLLALTAISVLAAGITFFYGFYAFPDAPIRKAHAGFADKQGLPRSEADYQMFKLWEKTLFASIGAAFLCGFSFAVMNGRERKRRNAL